MTLGSNLITTVVGYAGSKPYPEEVAGEMGSNLHDVVRPHLLTKRGSNLAHVGPYSTYRFTGIEP